MTMKAMTIEERGALLEMPVHRMQTLAGWEPLFELLPFTECARLRCALLRAPTDEFIVRFLVIDPDDTDLVAWARTRFGSLEVSLASEETFDAWMAHCESSLTALGSLTVNNESAASSAATLGAEILSLRDIGQDDSPTVRFVNSTLYDALKTGASDVHLESDPAGLNVKFRLDGVLTAIRRVDSAELAMQAVSRIKVMAQLDISERRVPQDGRLQITYAERAVDVLDRQHLAESLAGLTLAKLGFDEGTAEALKMLCRKPHGMLLVTGPTGSGKTTTLYAAIAETHLSRDKIITIEDPVEYQLPGVLQIPVNERKGLTFARGLRSILRHDPDKILVGEIRDAETAQIAVQSALTGHLVFTTVHANTVFDVVGRFGQFDIDAYTFASAINGVLAQRLVRRACPHCAEPVHSKECAEIDADWRAAFRRSAETPRLVRARGCERCRGTGYTGRIALGELLQLTPTLKSLISARASQDQLRAEAERTGWRSLRSLAIDLALKGLTTPEEVDRVAA
jgi:general secretion pathway protein E